MSTQLRAAVRGVNWNRTLSSFPHPRPCRTRFSSTTLPEWRQQAAPRFCRGVAGSHNVGVGRHALASDGHTSSNTPQWEWRLGLALGGCSFEAYNDPEEHDGLNEVTPSGSRIVYTDKEFLVTRMKGILQLTVKSASNLPAADVWPGKSDPYAVIQIGDSSCTTKVISTSLNPVWDETFFLYIRNLRQRLLVRVLDQDVGKSDDLLGTTMRGVADLCDGEAHQLNLDLRGAKGPAGQLHLEARFMPFTEVLAEEVSSNTMGGPVRGSPTRPLLARMPDMHLDTGKSSPWRELLELAGIARQTLFTPLCFIENTPTDSQAWLFWNRQARAVCVAFRGTEQAKLKDIFIDLSLVPAALNPERVKDAPRKAALAEQSKEPSLFQRVVSTVQQAKQEVKARRIQQQLQEPSQEGEAQSSASVAKAAAQASIDVVQQTAEDVQTVLKQIKQTIQQAQAQQEAQGEEGEGQPWVHHGFLSAYDSIRPQVLGIIDTLLEEEGKGEGEGGEGQRPWTVYLTGHSLGAALSTLCAYDLAVRMASRQSAPDLVLCNFGSPRVGNRAFAEEFNRLVPNAWRVVNRNDAVCTLPRLMGYCHVGHAVRLKEGGEVEVQRDTSDALGEGVAIPEMLPVALPKLTEKILEKVGVEVALAASSEDEGGEAPAAAAAASATLTASAVENLLEQEMQAWSLLFSGSSVNEHMEDLYLESLRAFAKTMAKQQDSQGSEMA